MEMRWDQMKGSSLTAVKLVVDVAIICLIFTVSIFFVPDIISKIIYTYNVLYQSIHTCFPRFTRFAFFTLIILPHFFAAAIALFFFVAEIGRAHV